MIEVCYPPDDHGGTAAKQIAEPNAALDFATEAVAHAAQPNPSLVTILLGQKGT